MAYQTYTNFSDFMERFVIPLKNDLVAKHLYRPDMNIRDALICLERVTPGTKTDGRRPAGKFPYRDQMWNVHWDTTFATLFRANKMVQDAMSQPFWIGPTRTGKGIRLNIVGDTGPTKGLCIYPYNPTKSAKEMSQP